VYKEVSEAQENNDRLLTTTALTFVRQGVLKVQDGDRFLIVHPGQFVLLPKGCYTITDLIPESGRFVAWVAFMSDELIRKTIDLTRQTSQMNEVRCYSQGAVVQSFFQALRLVYAEKINSPELTRLKLNELLSLLLNGADGSALELQLQAIVQRKHEPIKTFMEKHFMRPLSVEDYAFLSGRSISTFHRDFKSQLGKGPKRWLIEKRLQKAMELFKSESGLKVFEVMRKVGYQDLPHFSRSFKKEFGILPKSIK